MKKQICEITKQVKGEGHINHCSHATAFYTEQTFTLTDKFELQSSLAAFFNTRWYGYWDHRYIPKICDSDGCIDWYQYNSKLHKSIKVVPTSFLHFEKP